MLAFNNTISYIGGCLTKQWFGLKASKDHIERLGFGSVQNDTILVCFSFGGHLAFDDSVKQSLQFSFELEFAFIAECSK